MKTMLIFTTNTNLKKPFNILKSILSKIILSFRYSKKKKKKKNYHMIGTKRMLCTCDLNHLETQNKNIDSQTAEQQNNATADG